MWKKHLSEGAARVFDTQAHPRRSEETAAREQELYARIGQLQMEVEWVKKAGLAERSVESRRLLIEPEHPRLVLWVTVNFWRCRGADITVRQCQKARRTLR
ncbi:MAG: hypothetical protein EAZ92_14130 [Candidatus Kapaibacterium sp.]|nr:MAG: hypothetical protein EAZ92_14130 [Candidatus Kapabacteria bacterium]